MVIIAKNISKKFGVKAALDSFSVDIPENSVFLLIGPNGAGKTTFLRILSGELKAMDGNITPDNKMNTAIADEERGYFNNFNALDYSRVCGLLYPDFDPKEFKKRMDQLKIDLETPIEQYSKGMKTWLHNSFVISSNAKVMIFDEPLQHLDPSVRLVLHMTLKELKKNDRTVIISTHEVDEFHEYCDNAAIINDGKIVVSGEVDKLIFTHRMISGTETAQGMDVIGPVFNENLVKTSVNCGREPALKEIAAGYINGCALKRDMQQ